MPYTTPGKRARERGVRSFTMRSDSELLLFIFRSEKRMDLLIQSAFAKSDGIKSALRIRWPKSSDFGPKSDDSTHRILKSKNGIGLQSSKNPTEQSRPGTAAVRGTHKSMSSDRCVGLRIQPRCANAVVAPHRSQTTVGCRSTRARTQRTRRARPARVFRGYVSYESAHRAAAHRAGLGCFVEKKYHVKRLGTSLRGQTRV